VTERRGYIPPSQSVEWGTPEALFEALSKELGPFDLDAAASDELHVCPFYFTAVSDGLRLPWWGTVWCNPPYGRGIGEWVRKALREVATGRVDRVVMLVPAATSTSYWHDLVTPNAKEIRFLRGRLKFGGAKSCAPFASAVVVFEKEMERP
jgi:site-specific DNA-methyltransferase (adenine-specific)